MGGINPAGRTSGHQAFRRTVLDALTADQQRQTIEGLATLMRLASPSPQGWNDSTGQPMASPADTLREHILKHTLIRRNEDPRFSAPGLPANRQVSMELAEPLRFRLRRRQLPEHLPSHWQVQDIDPRTVEITVPAGEMDALLPDAQSPKVRAAAQLPTGFDPTSLYRSVHHPRGLAMTVLEPVTAWALAASRGSTCVNS